MKKAVKEDVEPELKACPFCGGEAKFESKVEVYPIQDENGAYIDAADIAYYECTGCPACDIWFYSDDDDEPEEITIERWNRRASDARRPD